MATGKLTYAASAAITCGLEGLADGGYQASAAVDNGTNLFIDAQISGSIEVDAVAADGDIIIWGYGSADDGTKYSGGLSGSDETVTWGTTPASSSVEGFNNLVHLTTISVDGTDDDNDIEFFIGSVAAAFGGVLPEDWGIVVENQTGTTLDATGTANSIDYQGITYDIA